MKSQRQGASFFQALYSWFMITSSSSLNSTSTSQYLQPSKYIYTPIIMEREQLNLMEFSIEKALQFVGDNSTYQKKRLCILSLVIITFAVLTCRMPLLGSNLTMLFLFASGAGQVLCPIYMSLYTISFYLAGCCILAAAVYPFSQFLLQGLYCAIGFFGRGFFISSLIYINEIGGDKFRAWSMILVFGIWGVSSFLESLQHIFNIPGWLWVYFVVILPFLVGCALVLQHWKPSPFHLFTKREFEKAKIVLNDMASENNRTSLPYGLQGEKGTDELAILDYKKPTYLDMINRPVLRKITIPLFLLWIYREYIYFGSYMILPQLGNEISKNLILLSVSETVAALMSYPIRLKIKRVNTFFGFILIIAVGSLISSFTTLDELCKEKGQSCASKYIYRVAIMLIRFSIALVGNILVSYTLEVYPSNVRSLGFSLCLGVSAAGSSLMPWINQTLIGVGLSGFIGFFAASVVALYFVLELGETNGKMRSQSLQELEDNLPMISLNNWANLLRFE